jgi:hypothetical protein
MCLEVVKLVLSGCASYNCGVPGRTIYHIHVEDSSFLSNFNHWELDGDLIAMLSGLVMRFLLLMIRLILSRMRNLIEMEIG